MENIIIWSIIVIIIADFVFEKWLDYLNIKHLNTALPNELTDVYDQQKYEKSQLYERQTTRFSLISGSFSTILILLMLLAGGFTFVDKWVHLLSENIYYRTLLFFGIIGFAFDLLSMPFQLYSVFVIEEKFGFNKTNYKTFFIDKLKSLGISLIIGGLLISFILWAYLQLGNLFVPVVLLGLTVFMIFMAMFYTSIFVPLFNKLSPLEEGSLKNSINEFALKNNFRLKNIYTIDGSKRSTKANAYFSGFGPRKTIVLYDTLINDLSESELIAVLAHEIGHYKKKHIYQGLAISVIQSAIMLYLLSLALNIPQLSTAIGGLEQSFYMSIIAFGLLYSPVSFITGIISNNISRKNEYQADNFANEQGLGNELISGLKKLSKNNLSNLSPHPLYVYFNYSHPNLLQRIRSIKRNK